MRAIGVVRSWKGEEINVEEFEELLKSAGYEIITVVFQRRREDAKYNIGRGKLKELKLLIKNTSPEVVVFANRLTPTQAYNLWKELSVEVIDRWQLVLQIFENHANSKEAKLQIELASLKYEIPFIKEAIRRIKLGDRAGFKGMGDYQTRQYLKHVRRRIALIRNELERVKRDRKLKRKRREESGFVSLTLAGYTNAGKTTLLNALSGSSEISSPKMFTTLETRTRWVKGIPIKTLLTDTVGFIENLPPFIVEAFHSTLEEITFSDGILLVLDASEPVSLIKRKLKTSFEVLKELRALNKPMLIVLNKADLIEDISERKIMVLEELSHIGLGNRRVVTASGLKGSLSELLNAMEELVFSLPKVGFYRIKTCEASSLGKVISIVEEYGKPLRIENESIDAVMLKMGLKKLTEIGVKVSPLSSPRIQRP